MSFSYGFFNAQLTSDGDYDRMYTAENFAEYFHLFVGNGVFANPATSLQVISSLPASMNVVVSAGYGWINGYYAKNTDEYPLSISVAHASLPRYDAIVLRWVNETRSMELSVLTGTAAASPVIPAVTRNTEVYELMLAAIKVEAGATNITQSVITDKRPDNTVCGWVTGLIDQIDTTNLFAQYDSEFTEWFENIQSQLEGDIATNLQNQIDQRVKIADKATVSEAQAGTNDEHWMTPDKVDDFYQAHKASTAEAQAGTNTNKFLTPASGNEVFNSSALNKTVVLTSSCVWKAPTFSGNKKALVMCVGGGGGGGGAAGGNTNIRYKGGGGGGGGSVVLSLVSLISGNSYNIIVGSGGAGGTTLVNGSKGGTTSFGTIISATGGEGGKCPKGSSSTSGGGDGGNGGSSGLGGAGGGGGASLNENASIGNTSTAGKGGDGGAGYGYCGGGAGGAGYTSGLAGTSVKGGAGGRGNSTNNVTPTSGSSSSYGGNGGSVTGGNSGGGGGGGYGVDGIDAINGICSGGGGGIGINFTRESSDTPGYRKGFGNGGWGGGSLASTTKSGDTNTGYGGNGAISGDSGTKGGDGCCIIMFSGGL